MLKSKSLLNVLLPETIESLGFENISLIKEKGKNSNFEIKKITSDSYISSRKIELESRRIKELARSNRTDGLDETGKILFCSELKFTDDNAIVKLMKEKEITVEDIHTINELIKNCQHADIKYTMALIQLENKYDLKLDQALQIIELQASLLNVNYSLNEADNHVYNAAKKLINIIKVYELKNSKCLIELNENPTLKKLIAVNKSHHGFLEEDFYLLINKINELIVTCPEKLMSNENQKKLN